MDATRRHKTPGSETKDFVIHGTARSMCISIFVLVTLDPKSCNAMGSHRCYAFSGFVLQLKNIEFGASGAFMASSKQASSLGVMDTFIILIAMIVDTVHARIKTYQTVHFKHLQFVVQQYSCPKNEKNLPFQAL